MGNLEEIYSERISSALPLHRAVVAVFFLLLCFFYDLNKYKSVSEGVLHFALIDLFDSKSEIYAGALGWHVVATVVFSFFSCFLFSVLSKRIFVIVKSAIDFNIRVVEMNKKSTDVNFFVLKDVENKINSCSSFISGRAALSEFFFGMFLLMLFAFYFGNAIDFLVSLSFLVLSYVYLKASIELFLNKFVPLSVKYRELTGVGCDFDQIPE